MTDKDKMIVKTLKTSWFGDYKNGSLKYFYRDWLEKKLQELPQKIKMYMDFEPFKGSKRFLITVNYHEQVNRAGYGVTSKWKTYSMSTLENEIVHILLDFHDMIMSSIDSTESFYLYLGFATIGGVPIEWQSNNSPPFTCKKEFSRGDIVCLKSGGPSMTVVEIEHAVVACMFFDEKNKKAESFPEDLLIYAPPN